VSSRYGGNGTVLGRSKQRTYGRVPDYRLAVLNEEGGSGPARTKMRTSGPRPFESGGFRRRNRAQRQLYISCVPAGYNLSSP
jgi:hypothetical protein